MNTKRKLVLIGWRRAQHYSEANPPWVKLYPSLFEHPAWTGLDAAAQSLLVNLWLYAARTTVDGVLWGDPDYLAAMLPVAGPVDLRPLLEATGPDGEAFPFVRWEDDPPCPREVRWAQADERKAARAAQAKARAEETKAARRREQNRQAAARARGKTKAPSPPSRQQRQQGGFADATARKSLPPQDVSVRQQKTHGESESEGESEKRVRDRDTTCDYTHPAEAELSAHDLSGKGAEPDAERQAEPQRQAEPERQAEPQRQAEPERQAEPQAQAQAQAQPSPPAPRVVENPQPPASIRLDPPDSDGPAVVRFPRQRPAKPPPGVRLLGQSLPRELLAMADPVKWDWIAELYRRLGFPYPMDSPIGVQEIGSFASVYDKLLAERLPPEDKAEILAHDLEWAAKNGRKRRNRKRGAVFCMVHNERVTRYLARRWGVR